MDVASVITAIGAGLPINNFNGDYADIFLSNKIAGDKKITGALIEYDVRGLMSYDNTTFGFDSLDGRRFEYAAIDIDMKYEKKPYVWNGRRNQEAQQTAIRLKGGNIAGFGLRVNKWVSSSDNTVNDNDSFIDDISNTGNKTFYMPKPQETWLGRVVMVHNGGGGKRWLQATVKNRVAGVTYFQWGYASKSDRWSLNDGQVGFMINMGDYWQCSVLDWFSTQW